MKLLKIKIFPILLFISLASFSQEEIKPLDSNLENYEYPFLVEFFEFQAQQQQLRMAYILETPENLNGKTVLLLHGKNFNAAYWKTTITALTEEGYQVLAPDQVGFAGHPPN